MANPNTALIYAVRPRVVCRFAGQLMFVAGLLTLMRLAVALGGREWEVALVSGLCSALLIIAGGLLARVRTTRHVQENEILAITAFVFLIVSMVSALPFYVDGISLTDAFFEAVSGITTTGLSTLDSVENRGFVFLFSRAWLQWVGGLGFVVVSIAMIVPSRVAARTFMQTFDEDADTLTGARHHARIVAIAYSGLTVAVIGALLLTGLDLRESILYALAGVSTGGFAPYDDSLASLTAVQQIAVQSTAALGALPLVMWYYLFQSKGPVAFFDGEFKLFLTITACVAVALGFVLWHADAGPLSLIARNASVLALSAQSTTGFAPASVSELPGGAKTLLIGSMLIGGEFGSTAGGMKIIRIVLLLKAMQVFFRRIAAPPDAVLEPYYRGHAIAPQTIIASAIVGGLYVFGTFALWLPFVLTGYAPLDALFEVASALGTVGLSAGVTADTLPVGLKLTLCAAMLLGRLEIVAWVILLSPRSWFGRREESI